jgi:cytochrome b pre-mRNA-processing protein 3
MILRTLRQKLQRAKSPAETLYAAIVAAARRPFLYAQLQVPDTVDGRFDMLVLHMFLVLERLQGEQHVRLRQELTDEFFKDMDRSLREMGTGDLAVASKVRKMAEAFFGRIKAYGEVADENALAAALARNVYVVDQSDVAHNLAHETTAMRQALADASDADVTQGKLPLE